MIDEKYDGRGIRGAANNQPVCLYTAQYQLPGGLVQSTYTTYPSFVCVSVLHSATLQSQIQLDSGEKLLYSHMKAIGMMEEAFNTVREVALQPYESYRYDGGGF